MILVKYKKIYMKVIINPESKLVGKNLSVHPTLHNHHHHPFHFALLNSTRLFKMGLDAIDSQYGNNRFVHHHDSCS